ncbi:hypothetical protein MC885_018459 [Smutsia gigantea]|nr:hypothetical protein MC885_018459 [Smutsia gigantea]
MQPTATVATAAPSAATITLTATWDNSTSRPTAEPDRILDSHVLRLVVMSLFVGGTLVVLSGVLLLCKRCWEVHRRLNRATEEAEKASTPYLDSGTHPAPDPDFRGEDPEGQDAETEGFLSTSSMGRRVSFNEAALFEQSRKTQDKGRRPDRVADTPKMAITCEPGDPALLRGGQLVTGKCAGHRYTLTEGDFHHLKNARLTHLHLPPLKIVTIHECDSGEASAATTPHATATPKASLSIFQPPGKALTGRSVGPSSALPGDPYNSAAGPADFEISPSAPSDSGEGTSIHGERGSWRGQAQDPARAGGRELQTPWGPSLSRAEDSRADQHLAEPLGACEARSRGKEAQSLGLALLPPLTPPKNSLSLLCTPHRWGGLDAGARSPKPGAPAAAAGPGELGPGSGAGPVLQFFTRLRRHASLDGASPYFKVKKWKMEPSQRASSLDTRGSPKRHHFQRQRAASESMEQEEGGAPDVDFIQYIASTGGTVAFPPPNPFLTSPTSPSPALGRLEAAEEAGAAGGASPESPMECGACVGPEQPTESDGERDAGPEQVQTIYHDIWSLRASLELHAAAASDHSSSGNDHDSVRSGDSSGSGSGGAAPAFPPPSPPPTPRPPDSEASGPRKLLQMDSGYASIEGRSAGEDVPPSASEKRSSFTSAGRAPTVGGSFEGAPGEDPDEMPMRLRSPRAWPRRAPRRDYSIDEKTDALFSTSFYATTRTRRRRHRVRDHAHSARAQQWQRGRQHSDPARGHDPWHRPPTPPRAPAPRRQRRLPG